jgi:hypothetical protein
MHAAGRRHRDTLMKRTSVPVGQIDDQRRDPVVPCEERSVEGEGSVDVPDVRIF